MGYPLVAANPSVLIEDSAITTGKIQAGAVTSDKLTIVNAMIADATIQSAKIATLDAGKITTRYLAAARIRAGTITSDKLTTANGFIVTAMIKDAAITNAITTEHWICTERKKGRNTECGTG